MQRIKNDDKYKELLIITNTKNDQYLRRPRSLSVGGSTCLGKGHTTGTANTNVKKQIQPPPCRPRHNPFALSHPLTPDLEVVVDGKTYGNDSRYCRRAGNKTGEANAVVRSLHLLNLLNPLILLNLMHRSSDCWI